MIYLRFLSCTTRTPIASFLATEALTHEKMIRVIPTQQIREFTRPQIELRPSLPSVDLGRLQGRGRRKKADSRCSRSLGNLILLELRYGSLVLDCGGVGWLVGIKMPCFYRTCLLLMWFCLVLRLLKFSKVKPL